MWHLIALKINRTSTLNEVEVRALYLNHVKYTSAINYRQYTVKVFICGDYKFLSKMYGLSGVSGMQ